MTDGILVSVVIPAFNAGRFLEETLASVLAQTHTPLEVIVVNDGSTDNTRQIAQALAGRDSRVKLIEQRNSGVSVARNTGAANSRGAFVSFLDADDVLTPDSLELKLQRLLSNPALGLVHCDHHEIDAESRIVGNVYSFPFEGQVLRELLRPGQGTSIFSLGSCLVRREVLETVGGFDPELSNSADHEFFFRVANRFGVGRVPRVGFLYRIHQGNMHSNIGLLERDLLTAYRKAERNNLLGSPSFRRACFGYVYLVLGGSWWKDGGDKWRGARYLLRAVLVHPPTLLRLARKLRFRRRGDS